MLSEAKKILNVTVSDYDLEIAHHLMAGASDLEIAGIVLPGTVSFTIGTNDEVTDVSTLTDNLCKQALFTYLRARFKQPANYEQLQDAYETQKVQLMHATGYTAYEEEVDDA